MKNNSILKIFFIIIVLNIIPSALLGMFRIPNKIYNALYAAVYFIQTVIMFIFYKQNSFKINKKDLAVIISIIFIEIVTFIYCLIAFEGYDYNEILVSLSVFTNIINFIILTNKINITKEELFWFLRKIIVIGIIAGVANIILNFKSLLNFSDITGSYQVKFSSFFPNRNTFGILMVICCISNQYIIIKKRKNKKKYIQIFFIINLLLTMSRNSIIGLLVFYVFSYIIKYIKYRYKLGKKEITKLTLIILTIITGIVILSKNLVILNRMEKLFFRTESLESGSGRFSVWNNGLEIFKNNNMITGIGRYKAIEFNKNLYNNNLAYFHSIYIEILAEYGIIGIMLLLSLFNFIRNKINKSKLDKDYLYLTKASFYTFLFISLFESTTRFSIGYADTISLIYFCSLPILIGNIKEDIEAKTTKEKEFNEN